MDLLRAPRYLAQKATLTAPRRLSLELAEEGIAVDPHSRAHRHERFDGSVVDRSEPLLMVSSRIVDERTVEMLEFLDLAD